MLVGGLGDAGEQRGHPLADGIVGGGAVVQVHKGDVHAAARLFEVRDEQLTALPYLPAFKRLIEGAVELDVFSQLDEPVTSLNISFIFI